MGGFDVEDNKADIPGGYSRADCVRERPGDGRHIGASEKDNPRVQAGFANQCDADRARLSTRSAGAGWRCGEVGSEWREGGLVLTAATPNDELVVKQLRNNEATVPMRANINAPPKEVGR